MALFLVTFMASLLSVSLVYSDSVYVGLDGTKNYASAKSACSGLSIVTGQLATFGGTADFNAIKSVRSELSSNAWVGLDDLAGESNWQFVDGDEDYCEQTDPAGVCDELEEWNAGEPNDYYNNEDCAELYSNGKLNDQTCSDQRAYICEFIIDGDTSVKMSTNTPMNPIIIPNSPFSSPSDNVYIFEFASGKDVALIIAVLLNIVLISYICCVMMKWNISNTRRPNLYGKVDFDDEKL